ncbi:unnamed protein product [Allacma fusca]|uniref:Uncharacterized protein n=1 Tax=Allacma fusca TaxID=39272 RepID=A0A8J2LBY9_9HEXA|nr:unnamed protein product [Allacma fusca]
MKFRQEKKKSNIITVHDISEISSIRQSNTDGCCYQKRGSGFANFVYLLETETGGSLLNSWTNVFSSPLGEFLNLSHPPATTQPSNHALHLTRNLIGHRTLVERAKHNRFNFQYLFPFMTTA